MYFLKDSKPSLGCPANIRCALRAAELDARVRPFCAEMLSDTTTAAAVSSWQVTVDKGQGSEERLRKFRHSRLLGRIRSVSVDERCDLKTCASG